MAAPADPAEQGVRLGGFFAQIKIGKSSMCNVVANDGLVRGVWEDCDGGLADRHVSSRSV